MINQQSGDKGEILDLAREAAEELTRIVDVSGYRFDGLAMPEVNDEDGSIYVSDHEQASLLRDCVIHNAGLSEGLLSAHAVAMKRVREYKLPMPGREQLARIRESKALCRDRIDLAKEIGTQITKLFDLEGHEYLEAK